jgi:hypothetical protein
MKRAHTVTPWRALWLLVALCALTNVGTLRAQANEDLTRDASARALFQEGLGLAEHGHWESAEDRFRRAYSLRASPVIAYNLASALAERGRLVEASEFLRKVQQDDKVDPGIQQSARRLQAELASRIARITIGTRDMQASDQVSLDGNPLLAAQLGVEIPIDPGDHTLRLSRGDEVVDSQTLRVQAGGVEHVTLLAPSVPSPRATARAALPGPAIAGSPLLSPQPSAASDNDSAAITSRWWFWTGVGVVAVGAVALGLAVAGSGADKTQSAFKGDFAPGSIKVQVSQ